MALVFRAHKDLNVSIIFVNPASIKELRSGDRFILGTFG